VSKNEEAIALEAITNHPEMVLRLEDFAGWRINWQDKAANILELTRELNLRLDSVVFIDDSAFERARVREAIPDVLVPDWPEDRMRYKSALLELRCFDTPTFSLEDASRAKMYSTERERRALQHKAQSQDEWFKDLEISVTVDELSSANLPRVSQLLNKTNQLNLTTRRLTQQELWNWLFTASRKLWTFQVSDRFGAYGLTGIASLEIDGSQGQIVDFVLSCRAMGRGIEQTMLSIVLQYSKSLGLSHVTATYIPTSKNIPCLRFLEQSGLVRTEQNTFRWALNSDYVGSSFVRVIQDASLSAVGT
jgi:FkbH-like protein